METISLVLSWTISVPIPFRLAECEKDKAFDCSVLFFTLMRCRVTTLVRQSSSVVVAKSGRQCIHAGRCRNETAMCSGDNHEFQQLLQNEIIMSWIHGRHSLDDIGKDCFLFSPFHWFKNSLKSHKTFFFWGFNDFKTFLRLNQNSIDIYYFKKYSALKDFYWQSKTWLWGLRKHHMWKVRLRLWRVVKSQEVKNDYTQLNQLWNLTETDLNPLARYFDVTPNSQKPKKFSLQFILYCGCSFPLSLFNRLRLRLHD